MILNREQQASFVRIVPDAVLETTLKDLQMGLTGLLCKSAGELVPTEGMAMGWCKEDPGIFSKWSQWCLDMRYGGGG